MTRSTDTHATKPGADLSVVASFLSSLMPSADRTFLCTDSGVPMASAIPTMLRQVDSAIAEREAGEAFYRLTVKQRDALSERVRVLEDNLATILDAYRLAMMALGRDAAAFDRSQEVIAARAALAGGGKA